MSTVAAMVAAVVPSLVSSQALAEKTAGEAPRKAAADAPSKDSAKPDSTSVTRGHAQKGKKTPKRAAVKGKTAKKSGAEAPRRHCRGTTIAIDRVGLEGQSLALLDCRDAPVASARAALSVLARPWGAPKPVHLALHAAGTKAAAGHPRPATPKSGEEIAPGVRLLDEGLLARLDAVAHRFPGRAISLVSGYRPQSRGSQHQAGRALDLRVAGVGNDELVAFCKTLVDTGCGYYPNSSFVHFDVREPGTGVVSWIDTSGPGEAPHYVHQWPPPAADADPTVLPPDFEPHDGSADPWMVDPPER